MSKPTGRLGQRVPVSWGLKRGLGTLPSGSGAGSGQVKDPVETSCCWGIPAFSRTHCSGQPFSFRATCHCPGRKELKEGLYFLTKYIVFIMPKALEIATYFITVGTLIMSVLQMSKLEHREVK